MGTTAQLDGKTATHGQHPNGVAILLAEQRHCALGLGGIDIGFLDLHRRIAADLGIDAILQCAELLRFDRFEVAEVEAQALTVHQGALLAHVLTENFTQRSMQQVGRRVVERRSLAH